MKTSEPKRPCWSASRMKSAGNSSSGGVRRRPVAILAVEELKKALGFKKRVVVPYRCLRCQQESAEWSGRCRHCGVWNTYVALPWVDRSGSEPLRDSGPAEARSIPYQGIASPFETV